MGERYWSPLHINLMLHYYAICEPWNRPSPAASRYTDTLVRGGLIVADEGSASGYKATPLGVALVEMWCAQPIPIAVYVDPRLSPKDTA
jgi:hypothetical protein